MPRTGLERYRHCRVCDAELSETQAEFALKRFEQATCSSDCARADIVKRHGCCELAKLRACVCVYSFTCPTHGGRCVGTHD